MMKKLFLLLAAAGTLGLGATQKKPVYDLTFEKNPGVILHGKAKIADKVLKLDGGRTYVTLPKSSSVHLTEKGLTLIMTAKLLDKGTFVAGQKPSYDMFFSKGKEFIFGRYDQKLYVNFNDGKKWVATTIGSAPVLGKWAQYAATFEHYSDRAQGVEGYLLSIYVNGELEMARRISWVKPEPQKNDIQIGIGFGGGPWFLRGEVAAAKIYQRALNDAEIYEEFAKDKWVKKDRKGFFEVTPALQQALKKFDQSGNPLTRWLSRSFSRAAVNGLDQKKLISALSAVRKSAPHSSAERFAAAFNAAQKDYRILVTPYQIAVFALGSGKGNHPLMGLYDRNAKREVFGDRTISWQVKSRKDKTYLNFDSNHPAVRWHSSMKGSSLLIKWETDQPFALEGVTELSFPGKRLESTCSFRSLAQDRIIEELVYPAYNFARISRKNDALVHPYMSGVEVQNPTLERFRYGQHGRYPGGSATMQFGAYYDDDHGIYYGYEDALGRTKNLDSSGKRGQLFVQWTHKVGLPVGKKGGNSFTANGKAVMELYGKGRWYEAGQIYRKFAQTACWWVKSLPRKSTPEWFRNNSLWLLTMCGNEESHKTMRDQVIALRKYFGMPFGIHWYGWDDSHAGLGWPHFPAKSFTHKINQQIRAAGVYTIPYIDNRLWAVKDGPAIKGTRTKTDYMFASHGKKYSAKDLNGKYYSEVYSKTSVYAIMCPAVKDWQDFMTALVVRLARFGFDGVYHDQVGTGSPRMCYDPAHGHDLHSGNFWLEQGFYPMFDKMFRILHKEYPSFCHTTEENAEVYLKQFDGYMVWRWTVAEQIPLFQSVYSGRAQFVGRLFDHQRRGDRQSFFSKVGQQLTNSEQIGWFTIRSIAKPDAKRLYVKKTMYIRKALLDFFNTGRMLAPIQWKNMPIERSKWGGNNVMIVCMPKIANSAWQGADNTRMWLFTNTQENEDVTAVPQIASSKGFWICREGAAKPVFSRTAQPVKLKRLCSEVWIEGPRAVAEKIQATMKKIASFDAGKPFPRKKFKAVPTARLLRGIPGKLYSNKEILSLSGCSRNEANTHVGSMEYEVYINFGRVDFGKKGANSFTCRVSVHPEYSGATLDILCQEQGKKRQKVGTLKLKSTGGWRNFKDITVKLKKPLTGKQNVLFYISGERAACNFAGWKYQEK